MIRASTWKPRLQTGLGLAAAAALVYAVSSLLVTGADSSAAPQKTAAPEAAPKDDAKAATKEAPKDDSKAAAPKSPPKAAPKTKKLTGSELYAIHCNRCHPERYPTEFNSAQWKTIATHMRVRANLPAAQAKEILKYLQEESGN